jgi:hypothetical protein
VSASQAGKGDSAKCLQILRKALSVLDLSHFYSFLSFYIFLSLLVWFYDNFMTVDKTFSIGYFETE